MGNDTPVWQSDEWQQAREELLRDQCQQCGSEEKLSLVHLWKPPRYRTVRAKVEQELISSLLSQKSITPFDPDQTESDEVRSACPECNSINLRERKLKKPTYKCGRCGYETDNPVPIVVRDEYLYNKSYQSWKDNALQPYEDDISNRITKKQEEFSKRYRSGEGTTTMCGKCAFLWTQKRMKFCQTCKERYHSTKYEQCYQCYKKARQIVCERCKDTKIEPQPGDIQICESCYETMWDDLTK